MEIHLQMVDFPASYLSLLECNPLPLFFTQSHGTLEFGSFWKSWILCLDDESLDFLEGKKTCQQKKSCCKSCFNLDQMICWYIGMYVKIHLVTGMYPKLWLVIDPIHWHSLGNWARECIWDLSQLKKQHTNWKKGRLFLRDHWWTLRFSISNCLMCFQLNFA